MNYTNKRIFFLVMLWFGLLLAFNPRDMDYVRAAIGDVSVKLVVAANHLDAIGSNEALNARDVATAAANDAAFVAANPALSLMQYAAALSTFSNSLHSAANFLNDTEMKNYAGDAYESAGTAYAVAAVTFFVAGGNPTTAYQNAGNSFLDAGDMYFHIGENGNGSNDDAYESAGDAYTSAGIFHKDAGQDQQSLEDYANAATTYGRSKGKTIAARSRYAKRKGTTLAFVDIA